MTRLGEKERGIGKLAVRLHENDKRLLQKLLEDADITYQDFAEACVQAFLRGDPAALKIIKDWRLLNELPKEHLDRYTLSHRERDQIAKELETVRREQDIDPRNKIAT